MKSQRPITLLTGLCFLVVAVSGVVAYFTSFSIKVVGLHALTGFAFIALALWHVRNSFRPMRAHLRSRLLPACAVAIAALGALLWWQPAPVRAVLGLSRNLGPPLTTIASNDSGLTLRYVPSPDYRMQIDVQMGPTFNPDQPPAAAVWLENDSSYHILTLHVSEGAEQGDTLPYWRSKVEGWEAAKAEAAALEDAQAEVDAVAGATTNSSFDPFDYIRPADPENPMPYRVLIEINQPGDARGEAADQPSLVYLVDVDNLDPRIYQLFELHGEPRSETNGEGDTEWHLYYPDEVGSAVELIDSSLLTIERGESVVLER